MKKPLDCVDNSLAEKMYDYWFECQNLSKTAKHFKRSRTTLHRVKSRYRWNARYEQSQKRVSRAQDKRLERHAISTLSLAENLMKRIAKQYLDPNKELNQATISEFIQAMKLVDDLQEKQSGLAHEEQPIQPEIQEALDFLTKLDKKHIIALGDHVAQIMEEEIKNNGAAQKDN